MRWLVLLCMLTSPVLVRAQDADALRVRYVELRQQLEKNQFKRPLYLESTQSANSLRGDVYALIGQPMAVVAPALLGGRNWCDIVILHLNVKSCRVADTPAGDMLTINIGRKFDQPLADTYRFEFFYRTLTDRSDYQQSILEAAQGPLGTSGYRIELELVGLDSEHSFLHLSYAYTYGMAAHLAMQSYLATIAREKVGFSIVGHDPYGQPVYLSGMRGGVERNTMRYYLAIDAYLGALSLAPPEQLDKRLNDWYAGVERYPLQLHELERGEYLDMKHREVQRELEPDN